MEERILSGFPHPHAFNPGLVRWQGRNFILYRVGWNIAELFLGELDHDFHPVGNFRKFDFPGAVGCEDARFFIHGGQLWFSFTVYFENLRHRIGIGRIRDDLTFADCRIITGPDPLLNEKNWIFFSHQDRLLLTYAIADGVHQVHQIEGDNCTPAYRTFYENPWKWGIARGGTQLVTRDGLLYSFFHATEYLPAFERQYYMGAYAVAPEPPFPIVKMSSVPLYTPPEKIVHPNATPERPYRVANIFPMGLIAQEDSWLVCAGDNNLGIKLFTIPHAELEANLVSTKGDGTSASEEAFTRSRKPARVHYHPGVADLDAYWRASLDFVLGHVADNETVYADVAFSDHFTDLQSYAFLTEQKLNTGINWIVLHKDTVNLVERRAIEALRCRYETPFANEVFVVFTNKPLPQLKKNFDPIHVETLWNKVDASKRAGDMTLGKSFAAWCRRWF